MIVSTAIILLASITGLYSTYSPCGLSMLSSINPISEKARGHNYYVSALYFLIGSFSGVTALAILLYWVRLIVAALLTKSGVTFSDHFIHTVLIALTLIFLVLDFFGKSRNLLTHKRQVNERWLSRYRSFIYAFTFGFQIGTGLLTAVMTLSIYTLVTTGLFYPNFKIIFLGLFAFGLSRGLAIFLNSWIKNAMQLMSLLKSLEENKQTAFYLLLFAQVLFASSLLINLLSLKVLLNLQYLLVGALFLSYSLVLIATIYWLVRILKTAKNPVKNSNSILGNSKDFQPDKVHGKLSLSPSSRIETPSITNFFKRA